VVKKFKGLTALLLCAIMTVMALSPTLAVDGNIGDVDVHTSEDGAIISASHFVVGDMNVMLRTIDMPNGDVVIYEYHDDILRHKVVIYANQRDRLHKTSFSNGDEESIANVAVQQMIMLDELEFELSTNVQINDQTPVENSTGGLISFRHNPWFAPAPSTHIVQVLATLGSSGTSVFTMNNQWHPLGVWAGLLIAFLGLPGVIASQVIGWALQIFLWSPLNDLIGFTTISLSANFQDFWYSFIYAGNMNHHFPTIGITRWTISDTRNPAWNNQIYWHGTATPWGFTWNVPAIWGIHAFAEVIHVNTLERIYGGQRNWSVLSWW